MRAWALLACVLGGCTVEPLDLTGRECPCVDGWVCDTTRNECVEASAMDAGRADAGGMDAARPDAGATDAGPYDAGTEPMDAGLSDAGADASFDAGPPPMDAGFDAGPPPPPSLCGSTHATRELCESFETGDLGRWSSTAVDGMGAITSVTDVVYRGTRAMRFECPRGCSIASAGIRLFDMDPQPTDIYVRGYYYFSSAFPPTLEHLQVGDSAFDQSAVSAVWSPTLVNWHAHDYLGDAYSDSPYTVPLDRWVCVELHVSTDAVTGGVELFWEGTRLDGNLMLNGEPRATTRIDSVYTGVVYREGDDATQLVYVDELVVGTTRIGCDP